MKNYIRLTTRCKSLSPFCFLYIHHIHPHTKKRAHPLLGSALVEFKALRLLYYKIYVTIFLIKFCFNGCK